MVCNFTLDKIYVHLAEVNGATRPEYRLPVLLGGAFFMPVTIILYGWITQEHWPAWLLLLDVGVMGVSPIIGVVPLMAYVVDAFGQYSASSMTVVLITRCLASTFLPLAIGPLTSKLG